jgi:anti-anti-sigma regulatory factor
MDLTTSHGTLVIPTNERVIMTITLSIEKRGEWEQLIYQGPINEDTEVHLMPTLQQLGSNVIFNFRKVEYVNSCGVRAWINYLREVEKGRRIIFEECTPEIVSQINMIPNFKGTAHIKSVYASYACNSCDHQTWQLFEEGRNLPNTANEEIPAPKCEKCGGGMDMEELEDEFFAWVEAG